MPPLTAVLSAMSLLTTKPSMQYYLLCPFWRQNHQCSPICYVPVDDKTISAVLSAVSLLTTKPSMLYYLLCPCWRHNHQCSTICYAPVDDKTISAVLCTMTLLTTKRSTMPYVNDSIMYDIPQWTTVLIVESGWAFSPEGKLDKWLPVHCTSRTRGRGGVVVRGSFYGAEVCGVVYCTNWSLWGLRAWWNVSVYDVHSKVW